MSSQPLVHYQQYIPEERSYCFREDRPRLEQWVNVELDAERYEEVDKMKYLETTEEPLFGESPVEIHRMRIQGFLDTGCSFDNANKKF